MEKTIFNSTIEIQTNLARISVRYMYIPQKPGYLNILGDRLAWNGTP